MRSGSPRGQDRRVLPTPGTDSPARRQESAPSRDKQHCPRAIRPLLLLVRSGSLGPVRWSGRTGLDGFFWIALGPRRVARQRILRLGRGLHEKPCCWLPAVPVRRPARLARSHARRAGDEVLSSACGLWHSRPPRCRCAREAGARAVSREAPAPRPEREPPGSRDGRPHPSDSGSDACPVRGSACGTRVRSLWLVGGRRRTGPVSRSARPARSGTARVRSAPATASASGCIRTGPSVCCTRRRSSPARRRRGRAA